MVSQAVPLEKQSRLRVTLGVVAGLVMSLLSFGMATFLSVAADSDRREVVAAVVVVFCLFGLIWLWPTWLAYSELRRRRRNVVNS